MNKYLFLLFIVCQVFVTHVFGQDLSSREKDGLLGKVRQVRLSCEIFSEDNMQWEQCGEDTVTIYDINGHRIFETIPESIAKLGPSILTMRFVSIFDFEKKGQSFIRENKDKDGIIKETRIFKYNDYGFCTSFIFYSSSGTKKEIQYDYQYDNYGNWVIETDYKVIQSENARKPLARYTRSIEYYQ